MIYIFLLKILTRWWSKVAAEKAGNPGDLNMASTLPDSDIIVQYSCFQTCSNLFKSSDDFFLIFLDLFSFQEIEKNSWNQSRAKRCDTNVLRSRAHWAEWRGLFWSRQKNSCNHGDLLLPRAIWRVFGDPGHHAPHTGSNAALHLYTPAAGLGPIRGFGTGGTLCRPRLKPKQEIEIPMFYNYLSQLQNLPSWAVPPCMLAPLVWSGVTYRIYTGNVYPELRKAGCVAVFTCIFGLLPSIRDGVLRSGMLLYPHLILKYDIFHPAKFDNFKDEKISDFKTVSVSQRKNLLDWKLVV